MSLSVPDYLSNWPKNISPSLRDLIVTRSLEGTGKICFADDLNVRGKTFVGTSVIPVSEFRDSRPNGFFEDNMKYSRVIEGAGSNLYGTCLHALNMRLEQNQDIEVFVVCSRFDKHNLWQGFTSAWKVLNARFNYNREREDFRDPLSMVFRTFKGSGIEYVYKQEAGKPQLANKLFPNYDARRLFI